MGKRELRMVGLIRMVGMNDKIGPENIVRTVVRRQFLPLVYRIVVVNKLLQLV